MDLRSLYATFLRTFCKDQIPDKIQQHVSRTTVLFVLAVAITACQKNDLHPLPTTAAHTPEIHTETGLPSPYDKWVPFEGEQTSGSIVFQSSWGEEMTLGLNGYRYSSSTGMGRLSLFYTGSYTARYGDIAVLFELKELPRGIVMRTFTQSNAREAYYNLDSGYTSTPEGMFANHPETNTRLYDSFVVFNKIYNPVYEASFSGNKCSDGLRRAYFSPSIGLIGFEDLHGNEWYRTN